MINHEKWPNDFRFKKLDRLVIIDQDRIEDDFGPSTSVFRSSCQFPLEGLAQ